MGILYGVYGVGSVHCRLREGDGRCGDVLCSGECKQCFNGLLVCFLRSRSAIKGTAGCSLMFSSGMADWWVTIR